MTPGSHPRRIRAGLLVLLGFLVAGCTATAPVYEGERRERDDVAIVKGLSGGLSGSGVTARIEAVDGEPLEEGAVRVELLPGTYEFVIFCDLRGISRRVETVAELHAGGSSVIGLSLDGEGRPDALIMRQ